MKKTLSQNGVATKKDLLFMEKRLRRDLASKDDLKSLELRVDYRIDSKFQDYMEKLDAKLFEWKSQIFNLVDGLAKMAKDKKEDKTIHLSWHEETNMRLESLEKIHPQGQHISS